MFTAAFTHQPQRQSGTPIAVPSPVNQQQNESIQSRVDSLIDNTIKSFPLKSRKMGEVSFLSDDEANTLITAIKSGRGFTYSERTYAYIKNLFDITHSVNDPLVSKTKLKALRIDHVRAVVDFNQIRILPNEPEPIISLRNMMNIGINKGGHKSLKAVETAVKPGSWLRKIFDQADKSESENQQAALAAILPIVSNDGGAQALKAVETAVKPGSCLRKIFDQADRSESENQQAALAAILPIVSNDGGAKALKAVETAVKPGSWLRKIFDQADRSESENQQAALAAILTIVSNGGGAQALKAVKEALEDNSWLRGLYPDAKDALAAILPVVKKPGGAVGLSYVKDHSEILHGLDQETIKNSIKNLDASRDLGSIDVEDNPFMKHMFESLNDSASVDQMISDFETEELLDLGFETIAEQLNNDPQADRQSTKRSFSEIS